MQTLIQTQLERIRARGVGSSAEINPFWRDLVMAVDRLLERNPQPSHAEIQKALGYAPPKLAPGATNWKAIVRCGIALAIDTRSFETLEKADLQHAAQLFYLKRKDLLKTYIRWADAVGTVSNLNLGRLYWYAERLQERLGLLGREGQQNIIEVGAGSGMLGCMLYERGLVRHYVIVDLPEMLLNAMISISESCPDADMRLGETPDLSIERPTFWFLETTDIEKAPAGAFDVALNINSMMEMDEEVRDFYLAQFDRTLRSGGLMYNVNRMQRAMTRRNGEPYENNPLTYPYKASDVVLEWEPDECQEDCRAQQMRTRHASFAITRMHLKG